MATWVDTAEDIVEAMEWKDGEDWEIYGQRSDAKFQELMDISDNLPEGEIVGAMLHWPRADGRAYYQVVCARPLQVQHIPYSDGWAVEEALIRGLRKADILEQIRRDRAWKKMFSQKNQSFSEAQAEHLAKGE